MESQEKQILRWLQSGKSLTSLDALRLFGCFRLSGRIYTLRKQGHQIGDMFIKQNGKKFKSYFMEA